jgi:hypothetical protein
MSVDVVFKGLKVRDLEKYTPVLKASNKGMPTKQQFKFVEAYIQTRKLDEAYILAGYAIPAKKNHRSWIMLKAQSIRDRPSVQTLLKLVIKDWYEEQGITVEFLVREALKTYDQADTIKDKIAALRFVSELGAFTGKVKGGYNENHKRAREKGRKLRLEKLRLKKAAELPAPVL